MKGMQYFSPVFEITNLYVAFSSSVYLDENSDIHQAHCYEGYYKTINQADNFELFVAVESRTTLVHSCIV